MNFILFVSVSFLRLLSFFQSIDYNIFSKVSQRVMNIVENSIYPSLLKESKENNSGSENSTTSLLVLGMAAIGGAGLMKWKGMI